MKCKRVYQTDYRQSCCEWTRLYCVSSFTKEKNTTKSNTSSIIANKNRNQKWWRILNNFDNKRGKEILEHLEISNSLTDSEKNDLELIFSKKKHGGVKRKYERRNPLTVELWEITSRCQYVESSECLFGSTGMRSYALDFIANSITYYWKIHYLIFFIKNYKNNLK